ncbi:hypothetical protein V7x_52030 [Crateriforma conspicua]|uniref:Uncharacterized protein n=1 Tax=Crateriforma conspicua TaxID=2527996 RepID=A0A5C6FSF4_9PLAN|nr:hypothetical protein V7x_52030 [Crateriforma conspicua]
MITWFEVQARFPKQSWDDVRFKLYLEGTRFHSRVNNCSFDVGPFSKPPLVFLRRNSASGDGNHIRDAELIGDVRSLNRDAASANAVVQFARQFN